MIKIQKPEREDIIGIQEVFYKTWISTYPNKEIGITREDIEDRFKNHFSEEIIKKRTEYYLNIPKNEQVLIAKDGPSVIGICRAIKNEEFNQLQAIYVLPDYQNKGIGMLLWNKIKEFLEDDKNIIVQVATYNDKAISFYKKLGFIDTGKRFADERFRMAISGALIPEMEMIIKNVK